MMTKNEQNSPDTAPDDSVKARFKQALEAKQNKNKSGGQNGSSQDSSVPANAQIAHKAQRFQRKSGG